MIRRLIILLLIVGCEEVLEPEDCAGITGGDAVVLWGLCYPTNTTSIELSHSELTGEIPSEIGNLIYLTELYLYSNQLTGEIPQAVCDLIESNNLGMNFIVNHNNLIDTCN